MTEDEWGGKVAVVTGGASGIGAEVVRAFEARRAHVVALDVAFADSPANDGVANGRLHVNVRDEAAVAAAVEATLWRWGRIDALVNAAGIEFVARVEDTASSDWDRVIDTNLKGCFLTCRAALPALRESRGVIVNVASQLGLVGSGSFAAYTASKSGVIGFTRSLAIEEADNGVRVNAVAPGAVDTPLLQRQFAGGKRGPQGSLTDLVAMHPVGRLGRPEEIAAPILFLCGEGASFITGSTLVVDGGYTAR